MEIKYMYHNLSLSGVYNVGNAIGKNIFTQDENGLAVSYGNTLGLESNGGDEFGSANGWRLNLNVNNIEIGVAVVGFNQSELIKETYINEIGHNLGLGHTHNTSIMSNLDSTTRNNKIGTSTTTYSYPNIDNKGVGIMITNYNRASEGTLGVIQTR